MAQISVVTLRVRRESFTAETGFGPGAMLLCLMTQEEALEKFSVPVFQICPSHYHSKIDPHSFFLNPSPMQYDIRHCS